MKDDTVVKYRFWHLSWSDEREQDWLREMARAGLHLVRATSGIGRYVFRVDAPRDMVYSVEYHGGCTARLAGHVDGGWEQVPGSGGWAYWRKPAAALRAGEQHVDPRTRAAMLQRLLGIMLACGMPMLINAVLFQRSLFDPARYSSPLAHGLVVGVYVFVVLWWTAVIVRLARRIHHYKGVAA